MKHIKTRALTLFIAGSLGSVGSAETVPLKVLLITGGCCHDYKTQKDILKQGIEARANITVDQIHTDSNSTSPDLPIYGNPDYAAGYDVVIHDECAAGISDEKSIEAVLAPHRNKVPAVNLHCAMHSYRFAGFDQKITQAGKPVTMWFEFLGLQSTGHGPQKPIAVSYTDKEHPILRGLEDWTTGNEELYNNLHLFKTAQPIASGTQDDATSVVVWTNNYNGTRVFNTSLGHNNETVADDHYLDLVTRGLLWAAGKLDPNGAVVKGYDRHK